MADDVTSDGKIYTFYLTKMDCFIALAMDVCRMFVTTGITMYSVFR